MRKNIAGIKSVKRSARARRGQLELDLRNAALGRVPCGRRSQEACKSADLTRPESASGGAVSVSRHAEASAKPAFAAIDPAGGELERSFREIRDHRPGFRLVHYSFQHDHAHLIVEAADARELASGMKALGARLARAVNRVFRRRGAVLADRSA